MRSVSRAWETWLSADRTRFAVCWPLNRVCWPVTPIDFGVVYPLIVNAAPLGKPGGIGGMSSVSLLNCSPSAAVAESVGR